MSVLTREGGVRMVHHSSPDGGEGLLAVLVPAHLPAEATTFLTPKASALQLGLVARKRGEEIPPHAHAPVERRVAGTPEVLLVRSGVIKLFVYTTSGEHVTDVTMQAGDVAVLLAGGHGLHFLTDGVVLEVKQGPYLGAEDKYPIDTHRRN